MPTDNALTISTLSAGSVTYTTSDREMIIVDPSNGFTQWNSPLVDTWADNKVFNLDLETSMDVNYPSVGSESMGNI
jgi:hypothetical protein